MTRFVAERGQAGGLEAIVFGLLIFVAGSLLTANVWGVIDAKVAAESAAREATRAYVESAGPAPVADGAADTAARAAIAGHGRSPARAGVERIQGLLRRCQRVTFEVRYRVPAIALPWIGGFGRGFEVASRHSEIVDPFRSGLEGAAVCDG